MNDCIQKVIMTGELPFRLYGSVDHFDSFNCRDTIEDWPLFQYILEKANAQGHIRTSVPLRSYINCNPQGVIHAGDFHTDDGAMTLLYYPFDWDTSWGGGTAFVLPDGTQEVVEYKKNRLAIFDATVPHTGLPHTSPKGFRFTVAFKTVSFWSDNA